jgi:quinol-cytochrome oxidoreductase complex cytochrome b subunit
LIGEWILRVLRGGAEISAVTLARFFGVHVWMLPAALLVLVGLHLYLVVRIGISAVPRRQE